MSASRLSRAAFGQGRVSPARVLAVGAFALLGCSGVRTPELEAPAPAVYGDGHGAQAPQPEAGTGFVDQEWWTAFGDPLLSRLVVEGLEHNSSLRAAALNVDAARAQARLDGAARNPELEAALDPGRRKQNTAQSGLTEAIPIPIPGFEPGGVRSFAFTSYGLALNLRWEVDLWDRLGALTAASLAEAAASSADLDGARLSVAGQLAKVYFGVVEALQQVELAERTLASRARTRDRVEARYRRGCPSFHPCRKPAYQPACSRGARIFGRRSTGRSRPRSGSGPPTGRSIRASR